MKIGLLKYLLLFALTVITLIPSLAQDVRVTSAIEHDSIWLGDQIKLTLVAEFPAGIKLKFPLLKDSIASGVEVIKTLPADSSKMDNMKTQLRQSFIITCFDSGPHFIPPIRIAKFTALSVDTISSNSLTLFVKVPNVDLKKGFTDIKKPFGAPLTLKEVAPWILGAILAGTLIFLIIYAISRRRRNIPLFSIPSKPKLPPYVVALSELEKLKGEQLWQQDKVKDYYTRLTDIIRVYLEDSFDIPAMELTTIEILELLKTGDSPVKGKLMEGLQKTLNTSDLVKFAKYIPYLDDHHFSMVYAYTLVEETKPVQAMTGKIKEEKPLVTTTESLKTVDNEIKSQP